MKEPMKKPALLAVFCAAMAISGCTTPDPYRVYVGKADDAKLIVRTAGMPMSVEFAVSASPVDCQGFESIGFVRDVGRQVLLPWVANLSARMNRVPEVREVPIPAHQVVQVKGFGQWFDNGGGRCGPLMAKFPVAASSTYLVEFVWKGTSACSMKVSQAAGSEAPRLLSVERVACPRSLF